MVKLNSKLVLLERKEKDEEQVSGSEEEGEAMEWVSTFLRPLPNITLRAEGFLGPQTAKIDNDGDDRLPLLNQRNIVSKGEAKEGETGSIKEGLL
ncbi:hypothetical protein TorRG33x02_303090 [Trema orientale]|uniref:Uncharacterized protein n=1 Tax=Trema orientale TaxID=63057 RepID=A0A2P5BZS0_TREOI|nr:hypothetical protein TorRG33x02_303090 [Trema orientale]